MLQSLAKSPKPNKLNLLSKVNPPNLLSVAKLPARGLRRGKIEAVTRLGPVSKTDTKAGAPEKTAQ